MKKLLLPSLLVISFFICKLSAAQSSLGSWNVINATLNFDQKWSVIGEAQIRSLKFYSNFHYYEFKGGVQYKLDKNFSFFVGAGNYNTYQDGGNFKRPMVNDETRTWVQLTMSQYLKRLKFEHRYRVEQRFTYTGYHNRFRYRLNCTIPINHKKLEPRTFYSFAFDEVFLSEKAPFFERNRAVAGVGYQLDKTFTLQAGFLNQYDYRINNEASKNYFQLTLLLDLRPHLRTSETIPVLID